MDLVIEIIGELVIESIIEIIKNKNISLIIRVPLFIAFSIMMLGLIGLMFYASLSSLIHKDILPCIFLVIVGLIILGIYIWFIYKLIRN